jgi:7-cyano-7-deazaguanine synthase
VERKLSRERVIVLRLPRDTPIITTRPGESNEVARLAKPQAAATSGALRRGRLVCHALFAGPLRRFMTSPAPLPPIGVLVSGGLDSCILLAHLLKQDRSVQPFYVHCHLNWEPEELRAVRRFCAALRAPRLEMLVELELPLDDLYHDHWSLGARSAPDASTPDEAVYLPGRNPLLVIKPALWCQLNGIEHLALALLGSNPFPDATQRFFQAYETALSLAAEAPITIERPFAELHKTDVMRLGRGLPLELTFSCIAPADGLHCGECNKCAERRAAFREASMPDPTRYAHLHPCSRAGW